MGGLVYSFGIKRMDILFLGIYLTGRHKEAIIKMYLVKIEKGKSEWPFQLFI